MPDRSEEIRVNISAVGGDAAAREVKKPTIAAKELKAELEAGAAAATSATAHIDKASRFFVSSLGFTGEQLKKTASNVLAFSSSFIAFDAVKTILNTFQGATIGSVRAAADFESALVQVGRIANIQGKSLQNLGEDFRQVARTTPLAADELLKVAAITAKLGISGSENIKQFSTTIAELSRITGQSADEASTALGRIAVVTKTPIQQISNLSSALLVLGKTGASTEQEITDTAQRLAGAGQVLGLSQSQILGFANALTSLGVNVEVGGSSFSRVFIRISEAAITGGKDLQTFARIAGTTADAFQGLVRTDPSKAVLAFLHGLTAIRQTGGDVVAVLDELKLQNIRVLDSILRSTNATDVFDQSLSRSNKAFKDNTELQIEFAQQSATTASASQRLANNIKDIQLSLGGAFLPATAKSASFLSEFLRGLNNQPGGNQLGESVRQPFVLLKQTLDTLTTPLRAITGEISHTSEAARVMSQLFTGLGSFVVLNGLRHMAGELGLVQKATAGVATGLRDAAVHQGLLTQLFNAEGQLLGYRKPGVEATGAFGMGNFIPADATTKVATFRKELGLLQTAQLGVSNLGKGLLGFATSGLGQITIATGAIIGLNEALKHFYGQGILEFFTLSNEKAKGAAEGQKSLNEALDTYNRLISRGQLTGLQAGRDSLNSTLYKTISLYQDLSTEQKKFSDNKSPFGEQIGNQLAKIPGVGKNLQSFFDRRSEREDLAKTQAQIDAQTDSLIKLSQQYGVSGAALEKLRLKFDKVEIDPNIKKNIQDQLEKTIQTIGADELEAPIVGLKFAPQVAALKAPDFDKGALQGAADQAKKLVEAGKELDGISFDNGKIQDFATVFDKLTGSVFLSAENVRVLSSAIDDLTQKNPELGQLAHSLLEIDTKRQQNQLKQTFSTHPLLGPAIEGVTSHPLGEETAKKINTFITNARDSGKQLSTEFGKAFSGALPQEEINRWSALFSIIENGGKLSDDQLALVRGKIHELVADAPELESALVGALNATTAAATTLKLSFIDLAKEAKTIDVGQIFDFDSATLEQNIELSAKKAIAESTSALTGQPVPLNVQFEISGLEEQNKTLQAFADVTTQALQKDFKIASIKLKDQPELAAALKTGISSAIDELTASDLSPSTKIKQLDEIRRIADEYERLAKLGKITPAVKIAFDQTWEQENKRIRGEISAPIFTDVDFLIKDAELKKALDLLNSFHDKTVTLTINEQTVKVGGYSQGGAQLGTLTQGGGGYIAPGASLFGLGGAQGLPGQPPPGSVASAYSSGATQAGLAAGLPPETQYYKDLADNYLKELNSGATDLGQNLQNAADAAKNAGKELTQAQQDLIDIQKALQDLNITAEEFVNINKITGLSGKELDSLTDAFKRMGLNVKDLIPLLDKANFEKIAKQLGVSQQSLDTGSAQKLFESILGPGFEKNPELLAIFEKFVQSLDQTRPGGGDYKGIQLIQDFMSGKITQEQLAAAQTQPPPPGLASGDYVKRAQLALVGEAGPEVIIPLTKPTRAKELAEKSGLLDVLGIKKFADGGIVPDRFSRGAGFDEEQRQAAAPPDPNLVGALQYLASLQGTQNVPFLGGQTGDLPGYQSQVEKEQFFISQLAPINPLTAPLSELGKYGREAARSLSTEIDRPQFVPVPRDAADFQRGFEDLGLTDEQKARYHALELQLGPAAEDAFRSSYFKPLETGEGGSFTPFTSGATIKSDLGSFYHEVAHAVQFKNLPTGTDLGQFVNDTTSAALAGDASAESALRGYPSQYRLSEYRAGLLGLVPDRDFLFNTQNPIQGKNTYSGVFDPEHLYTFAAEGGERNNIPLPSSLDKYFKDFYAKDQGHALNVRGAALLDEETQRLFDINLYNAKPNQLAKLITPDNVLPGIPRYADGGIVGDRFSRGSGFDEEQRQENADLAGALQYLAAQYRKEAFSAPLPVGSGFGQLYNTQYPAPDRPGSLAQPGSVFADALKQEKENIKGALQFIFAQQQPDAFTKGFLQTPGFKEGILQTQAEERLKIIAGGPDAIEGYNKALEESQVAYQKQLQTSASKARGIAQQYDYAKFLHQNELDLGLPGHGKSDAQISAEIEYLWGKEKAGEDTGFFDRQNRSSKEAQKQLDIVRKANPDQFRQVTAQLRGEAKSLGRGPFASDYMDVSTIAALGLAPFTGGGSIGALRLAAGLIGPQIASSYIAKLPIDPNIAMGLNIGVGVAGGVLAGGAGKGSVFSQGGKLGIGLGERSTGIVGAVGLPSLPGQVAEVTPLFTPGATREERIQAGVGLATIAAPFVAGPIKGGIAAGISGTRGAVAGIGRGAHAFAEGMGPPPGLPSFATKAAGAITSPWRVTDRERAINNLQKQLDAGDITITDKMIRNREGRFQGFISNDAKEALALKAEVRRSYEDAENRSSGYLMRPDEAQAKLARALAGRGNELLRPDGLAPGSLRSRVSSFIKSNLLPRLGGEEGRLRLGGGTDIGQIRNNTPGILPSDITKLVPADLQRNLKLERVTDELMKTRKLHPSQGIWTRAELKRELAPQIVDQLDQIVPGNRNFAMYDDWSKRTFGAQHYQMIEDSLRAFYTAHEANLGPFTDLSSSGMELVNERLGSQLVTPGEFRGWKRQPNVAATHLFGAKVYGMEKNPILTDLAGAATALPYPRFTDIMAEAIAHEPVHGGFIGHGLDFDAAYRPIEKEFGPMLRADVKQSIPEKLYNLLRYDAGKALLGLFKNEQGTANLDVASLGVFPAVRGIKNAIGSVASRFNKEELGAIGNTDDLRAAIKAGTPVRLGGDPTDLSIMKPFIDKMYGRNWDMGTVQDLSGNLHDLLQAPRVGGVAFPALASYAPSDRGTLRGLRDSLLGMEPELRPLSGVLSTVVSDANKTLKQYMPDTMGDASFGGFATAPVRESGGANVNLQGIFIPNPAEHNQEAFIDLLGTIRGQVRTLRQIGAPTPIHFSDGEARLLHVNTVRELIGTSIHETAHLGALHEYPVPTGSVGFDTIHQNLRSVLGREYRLKMEMQAREALGPADGPLFQSLLGLATKNMTAADFGSGATASFSGANAKFSRGEMAGGVLPVNDRGDQVALFKSIRELYEHDVSFKDYQDQTMERLKTAGSGPGGYGYVDSDLKNAINYSDPSGLVSHVENGGTAADILIEYFKSAQASAIAHTEELKEYYKGRIPTTPYEQVDFYSQLGAALQDASSNVRGAIEALPGDGMRSEILTAGRSIHPPYEINAVHERLNRLRNRGGDPGPFIALADEVEHFKRGKIQLGEDTFQSMLGPGGVIPSVASPDLIHMRRFETLKGDTGKGHVGVPITQDVLDRTRAQVFHDVARGNYRPYSMAYPDLSLYDLDGLLGPIMEGAGLMPAGRHGGGGLRSLIPLNVSRIGFKVTTGSDVETDFGGAPGYPYDFEATLKPETVRFLGASYGSQVSLESRGLTGPQNKANLDAQLRMLTHLMIENPHSLASFTNSPASDVLRRLYKMVGFEDEGGMQRLPNDLNQLKQTGFTTRDLGLEMATGGFVNRPTRAIIGEAGPEAVVPLDRFGSIFNRPKGFRAEPRSGSSMTGAGSGGNVFNADITIMGAGDAPFNIAQRTVNGFSRFAQIQSQRRQRVF